MDHYYLTGPRSIERADEAIPRPGSGEVLVRLAYTALSPGSNVFVWRTGSYPGGPQPERQELLYMGSGLVEAVGEGVTTVSAGDSVCLATGHQAWISVPEPACHRIPDGLGLREASLAYLSSWSVSALHLGGYRAAENVVVVGQGLVGASAALVADLMGGRVLGLDVDPVRVAFSRTLELGAVVHAGTPETAEEIGAFLGPTGADLILETSGHWSGFQSAIEIARDYSRIAIMGIYRELPPADLGAEIFRLTHGFPSKFHYRRLQIIGCGSDPASIAPPAPSLATTGSNFAYVLEQAARGRLRLDRLVTHVLRPPAIGQALARLAGGESGMVGVVFDWSSPGGDG